MSMAAAVQRGGGGGALATSAPSMRCSGSTGTGGASFASEVGCRSYVSSRAPSSRVRLVSSSSARSSSSPPFMGAAGTRFGLVFRALRRSSSLQVQKLPRKGLSPSPTPASRAGSVIRSVWKQEVLWANAPVAEVEKAAESLFHVVLDVTDNPELIDGHTKPGQFVQVKVGDSKPAFLAIASPPELARKGRLEFLIKDPGVDGSTAGIIRSLGKGDKVELSQVLGNGFKVEQLEPADEHQTVLLFATGSGISAIRSLIEAGFKADKRSDVRLYYGARNLERMAYQEKFKDWEASGVRVVPVLSQPDSDWSGAQGYVQAFFSKDTGIADGAQAGALLCGHKGMAQPIYHKYQGGATYNSARQDLRTEELLSGRLTPARMKAGLNLSSQGRLQSRASYSSRDWCRGTGQGNASTHIHSAGTTSQAIAILQNRLQRGITTDFHTYVKVLQMCLRQKDLFAAKQAHDCIIQSGMDKNIYVAGTLLNVYIKCGGLVDARRVFDQLEMKSVVAWTNMISGYAKSDHAESALELFNQMRHEGVEPNEITYLSILKACTSLSDLKWGKEIHECIRHAGFESDVRVGTALVKMYAKCGCIIEARHVFENLTNRNLITWNVMIGGLAQHGRGHEAYRLFCQMRQEGFEPDAFTYVSILNASASAAALKWVKEVHVDASKVGLESDLRVGNALVHMYAESGSIDDARRVFNKMKKRDIVTWNVMIGGLAQHGCEQEAYRLFRQMTQESFEPDAFTYVSILNASASTGALEWVKEVHGHASKAGLESDVLVGSALIHMYAKSGSIDDARLVFDRMEKRDVASWNVMIGGLAQHGCGHEAYRLFLQMRRDGFKPNAVTYMSILNASASAGALEWVKEVHGHASKAGLASDLRVGSALVHMYAKSGSIDDARMVFDRMQLHDVVSWTTMIGGLAEHGCGHEALELFRKMNACGVEPNRASFVAVLSACCHAGLLDEGRRLFSAMMQDYGIEPTVVEYTCMVDLLGRGGYLEEAKLFISNMPVQPDGVTWTALLGACRSYGNVELGEIAANEIFKLEPHNASAYVLLSNIYAAAGKWEKVSLVRTMMVRRGVRKEPGRTWIEVDNKIHEFAVGDTSHPEAQAIYTELNKLTEKLKAGGYIPDTRLVLHDISEEDKELALCSHSEKLAIAYGLMHIPRGEPIRVRKNLRVCPDCHTASKLISKVTGREIIARDANRFHHFKDGVCSCGDYW